MSTSRKKFGDWGEEIAVRYLIENGFSILMRNFRAERGEIDIIAREGDCVVFVEVKTGRSDKFGPPEERITRSKQRQLYRIASHFIQQNPDLEADYRFDAVIIDGHPGQYEIRHYRNAFYL
jgi:putative endonuclease